MAAARPTRQRARPRRGRPPAGPGPGALGARLLAERERLGLTQAELGARLELANGNFVGMVERGERLPSDELLRRWAAALRIPPRDALRLRHAGDPASPLAELIEVPPRLPRLRALVVDRCLRPERHRGEIEACPLGTLERLALVAVRDGVVLPSLRRELAPPPRLAALFAPALRGDAERPALEALEEIGELVASYAAPRFSSWDLDDDGLALVVRFDPEGARRKMLPLLSAEAGTPAAGPDLLRTLAALGLPPADVDELSALVAIKRARRSSGG